MKQGIITDLLDYYYSEPDFEGEIIRAADEFFGHRRYGEIISQPDEKRIIDGLFNEWLVYDFKMENGRTLLEDFCESNPFEFSKYELQDYRELLKNRYAMFETLKVRWHKGLEIRDLQTGKEYWVKEKLGTEQVEPGYVFFSRVAKIGDHWELVSADGPAFSIKLEDGARKYFSEIKENLSPRDIYKFFYQKDGKEKPRRHEEKDPKKAEENFQHVLEKLGLAEFVSARTVGNWIENGEHDRPEGYMRMIFGLLDKEGNYNEESMDELIAAFSDFHNSIAQRRLNGKSPNDVKAAQKEGEADWRFNITPMGSGEWIENQYEAHEYFKKNDPEKSLEYYNKCFESLLENKIVEREIYRIFANKATAHFQLGEAEEALALLDMALDLNPNYDFARKTLEKYQRGEYADIIMAGTLEKMQRNMSDPELSRNKWNFEEIEDRWPAEKILTELKKYGINAEEKGFREVAASCQSVDDSSKKYFFDRYNIEDKNADFVSMAAYGLWRLWCPDIPSVEFFSRRIEEFWDTVFEEEDNSKKKKTEKELQHLEKTTDNASFDFFKKWRGMSDYRADILNLSGSLGRLVGTRLEEKALRLAEKLKKKTGQVYFDVAKVCSAAYHNENWRELLRNLSQAMPYEYDMCLDVAEVFNRLGNKFLERECLEIALVIVKNRDENKVYDLEESRDTIYEGYKNVLKQLEEFYGETGDEKGLDKIKRLKRNIKSRKEELSESKRKDDMIERLAEFEEKMFRKRFESDPANCYFQFLKKTGINFATRELTKSIITAIGPKKKIGRNDPCPCGSRKKYKKCCL